MIRQLLDRFGGAGRRSGVAIFNAIADRARRNQRWARSRKSRYRVEDFQIYFPDSSGDRLRRFAVPLTVATALVVSVGFIGTVAYNVTRGEGAEPETVAAAAPGGEVGETELAAAPPEPELIEEGSAVTGPVEPLDAASAEVSDLTVPSASQERVASAPLARDRGRQMIVGTGRVTGVYFPTGGAICEVYNATDGRGIANCTVTSTGGSIDNLNLLREGELDFAVVQSDWQFHAYEGSVRLAAPGAFTDLRALFSIYVEPLTIVARGDSDIRDLDDLPGSRLAMGEPGSGQYEATKVLMETMGWTSADFDHLSTEPASGHLEALCLGEVDAVVMVAGHPNGATMGITNSCDAVLVDISGPEIDSLIAELPYFAKATIPGGFYPGNPDPVVSFGVAATLVASATLAEDAVYDMVRAVFENFDTFRRLHPAFNGLASRDMVSRALSAPLHEGALRYYRERGWQ